MHIPPNACDSHIHIIDPRFPAQTSATVPRPGMTLPDYDAVRQRLGLSRAVIVQPKCYGTDNRCTLDAIAQMNGQARGIAVVRPDVTEEELQALHDGGIRGVRFSLWNTAEQIVSAEMLMPVAERIRPFGWHLQLHMSGDQYLDLQDIIVRLPVPIVFDHMGRLPPTLGTTHPTFKFIRERVDAGQAWVKLSGAYLNTEQHGPDYPDAASIARAYVRSIPERLVWGSDWPHVTESKAPDTAALLSLLSHWVDDSRCREAILVENPARLYGFA